jgi:hypothetical protein
MRALVSSAVIALALAAAPPAFAQMCGGGPGTSAGRGMMGGTMGETAEALPMTGVLGQYGPDEPKLSALQSRRAASSSCPCMAMMGRQGMTAQSTQADHDMSEMQAGQDATAAPPTSGRSASGMCPCCRMMAQMGRQQGGMSMPGMNMPGMASDQPMPEMEAGEAKPDTKGDQAMPGMDHNMPGMQGGHSMPGMNMPGMETPKRQ